VVVENARHPELPRTHCRDGVVMLGHGFSSNPGLRLAWVPLRGGDIPRLQDVRYWTGDANEPWSDEEARAAVLIPHTNTYTHVSLAWLEGPQCWIVLYSNAYDDLKVPDSFTKPAVARFGRTLLEWSEEVEIFNPQREGAWGRYVHRAGLDRINPDIPPSEDPAKPEHDGRAYGAFILNRYTEWHASSRELIVYCLLSLSAPYQVQLMETRLHLE
jgi:hypothetical protein